VPGLQAAFLTSAGFTVAALVVSALVLRDRRTPAPEATTLEPVLVEAA
jgi:hypothetical protein